MISSCRGSVCICTVHNHDLAHLFRCTEAQDTRLEEIGLALAIFDLDKNVYFLTNIKSTYSHESG